MKRIVGTFCAAAMVIALAACGGGSNQGSSQPADVAQQAVGAVPGEDDSIKIVELDWTVEESVIDGVRRVALSYTNDSPFTVMYFEIEFTQREDVTEEERSVFDELYTNPDYVPDVEPSEFYVVGRNEHYVAPGETADPVTCSLAYSVTNLTMDQFALMEPSVATIRYVGGDGNTYLEYYDFLNQSYRLNEDSTEELVDSWPDSELAQLLPAVEAPAVVVDHDDADSFMCHGYGASEDDFAPYVEKCKEAGFTTIDHDGDTWFVALNEDGYEIDVNYYSSNDSLCVEITAPD